MEGDTLLLVPIICLLSFSPLGIGGVSRPLGPELCLFPVCPNPYPQTLKNPALGYLTHTRISAPKKVERDVEPLVTLGM